MTRTLALTGADLIRTLGNAAALASVDQAVRARAEALAREVEDDGAEAHVVKRGEAAYEVVLEGTGNGQSAIGSRQSALADQPSDRTP